MASPLSGPEVALFHFEKTAAIVSSQSLLSRLLIRCFECQVQFHLKSTSFEDLWPLVPYLSARARRLHNFTVTDYL
jgi:hypothetical protein